MTVRIQSFRTVLASNLPLLFWVIVATMSAFPNILWREGLGTSDAGLFAVKMSALLLGLVLTQVTTLLRPLRSFVLVLMVLFLAEWATAQLGQQAWWRGGFQGETTFVTSMLSIQVRRLLTSFVIVTALLLLKRDRRAIFLTRGDMRASAQPVRLLGMPTAEPWSRFGVTSLFIMSGALLTFLFIAGRPTLAQLSGVLPFLPFVALFALINSWSEEISYRVSLIATSESVVGSQQAVWLSAVFFGIGHYYGVPYGIIGVLLSTFFGFLLGKSLVETRGLVWAWILHFLADVWVFGFMVIGSVTPGG